VEAAPAVIAAAATSGVAASVEVTTATVTVAAVEVSAAVAVIVSATTVIAVAAAAIVPTATVGVAASVAVEPRSSPDEDTAYEPVRTVIAVGCASVRIIVIVAVFADWRAAVIDRGANSDAEGYALGVRVRRREETNTEANSEQTENF
jgi:hypothetical protein